VAAAVVLVLAVVGRGEQAPPATEVYLAAFDATASPAVTGSLINISNNPGYDDQPSFLPDGSAVLFASNRDGQQTDIYRYEIAARRLVQVTDTVESEYSPLVTPDGGGFSVIQVEADGTQRLWRFDLDGGSPSVVLDDVKPVGYHVWISSTELGLFVLGAAGQPATLQLAETTTGTASVIESNIGRSLLMRPGTGTMSFVSAPRGQAAVVKELNLRTRRAVPLVEALEGSQDCAWDPVSGQLLMASGTRIFAWSASRPEWRLVADLSSAGIGAITRMAVSPDAAAALRLAIVAEPRAR
jgi:dipeptidyl aminopeptidase/acylaminoacyl peptidase